VTIAVSTTPALVRLKPFLGQIAKDLRLLLGNNLPLLNELAEYDPQAFEQYASQYPELLTTLAIIMK